MFCCVAKISAEPSMLTSESEIKLEIAQEDLETMSSCVCSNKNRYFKANSCYFPYPHRVVFMPKLSQSMGKVLPQHEIEN